MEMIEYNCYRCDYKTLIKIDYEKHCVTKHIGKCAYPNLPQIKLEKGKIKPQGQKWE
jgi:hypothetical protein